ncbi:MAG TPA: hypothetical protein VLL54_20310 [Pyrinomonadaceae bacterium]|nr:hypothetical protein [Pyrinomonadaceae bacterium]
MVIALTAPGEIQLWLKLLVTVCVCAILVINVKQYGPGNLLWFSDVGLITTALALWFESSLLASMTALSVVLLDVVWNFGFFFRLLTGVSATSLTAYMFDKKIPLPLRAISLFHIPSPILLLWMIHRLGYDSRALLAQTALAWVVLPLTYLLTDPAGENFNWVHGFGEKPEKRMPPLLHLLLLMIGLPLVVYLPTHLLLKWIFS